MLLESAATEESPDQRLDVGCCFLLILLSSPLLPGQPGFVQERGLGGLRYTKHCAPWKRRILPAALHNYTLIVRILEWMRFLQWLSSK